METVATFLYARLRNVAAICQSMAGDDLATFVGEVRRVLSEPVAKQGGVIAQLRADSILAVFATSRVARISQNRLLGMGVIGILSIVVRSYMFHVKTAGAGVASSRSDMVGCS